MITITIDYDPKNEKESAKIEEIAEVIQEILEEKEEEKEELGRLYPDGTVKLNLEKVEMTEEGLKIKGRYQDIKDKLKEIGVQDKPILKEEKANSMPEDDEGENRFKRFDIMELLVLSLGVESFLKKVPENGAIFSKGFLETLSGIGLTLDEEIEEARK